MPLKKMFQQSEKKETKNPSNEEKNVPLATAKKLGPTTQIKIRYNAGFPNNLFIRGQGAGLSWEKGIPLKNIKEDEWIWETNEVFPSCQFKLLLNDLQYENGDNHEILCGSNLEIAPNF